MAISTDDRTALAEDEAMLRGPRQVRRAALREDFRALKPMLWTVGALIAAIVVTIVVSLIVSAKGPAGDVAVSLTDYRITMPTTLRTGHHTIALSNDGKNGHELLIFRTDLPATALPVDADGNVIEDAPQLDKVLDSGDALKPGGSQSLPVTLDPGHYVAVCNLPAHYRLGMRLDLTVNPRSP
jgi:uncharacterized cupredoxin-like copper-binding protein